MVASASTSIGIHAVLDSKRVARFAGLAMVGRHPYSLAGCRYHVGISRDVQHAHKPMH
jgi:hypothetical protein